MANHTEKNNGVWWVAGIILVVALVGYWVWYDYGYNETSSVMVERRSPTTQNNTLD